MSQEYLGAHTKTFRISGTGATSRRHPPTPPEQRKRRRLEASPSTNERKISPRTISTNTVSTNTVSTNTVLTNTAYTDQKSPANAIDEYFGRFFAKPPTRTKGSSHSGDSTSEFKRREGGEGFRRKQLKDENRKRAEENK